MIALVPQLLFGQRVQKATAANCIRRLTAGPPRDHCMVMKSVSIAELKSKLSHYLAAVKGGNEIVVTSHRHSIARIVPVEKQGSDLRIIPAKKPVSTLKKIKGLNLKVDLLADLLADRRKR